MVLEADGVLDIGLLGWSGWLWAEPHRGEGRQVATPGRAPLTVTDAADGKACVLP